jgi:hypothetical protein
MIVGEDWLEECSPMWVHWANKVMRFTYLRKRIELQCVRQQVSQCPVITAIGLQGLLSREAIQHCVQFKWDRELPNQSSDSGEVHALNEGHAAGFPHQIQSLLDDFEDLFQEPTSLPPQRPFDHHIQLLPGAPPVNIRPYKYSPAQKDEIEKQITE